MTDPVPFVMMAYNAAAVKRPFGQLRRNVFDHYYEGGISGFGSILAELARYIQPAHLGLQEAAALMVPILRGDPQDPAQASMYQLNYSMAFAWKREKIWLLTEDAMTTLERTELPWAMMETELPRMPHPAILIVFPQGSYIDCQTPMLPVPIRVTSVLLIDEIPGTKIRMLGFQDSDDFRGVANTGGHFDLRMGPVKDRMPEYAPLGEDAIWRIVFNLLLTLQYGYLWAGKSQTDWPDLSRKGPSKAKIERRKAQQRGVSQMAYQVINLSHLGQKLQTETQAQEEARAKREGLEKDKRPIRGFWRSYWVLDPGAGIILGSEKRGDKTFYKVGRYIPPHYGYRYFDPEKERRTVIDVDPKRGLPRP